jgi:pimeloyl-ACP methyl ester carboxylesterase
VATFRQRYRIQMEFRGFRRAILSTLRANMLGSFEDLYARLGKLAKRILLVWGEQDKTVPFGQSRPLRRLLPGAEFMPVPNCGHIPHYERPDLINPRLLAFLS